MKTKKWLIFTLYVFAIAPIIIATTVYTVNNNNKSDSLVKENIQDTTFMHSDKLVFYFNTISENMQILANQNETKKFISSSDTALTQQAFSDKLSILYQNSENAAIISLANSSNIIVASSDKTLIGKELQSNTTRENELIIQTVSSPNYFNGEKHLLMTIPILSGNENIGSVCYFITMETFNKIATTSTSKHSQGESIVITDKIDNNISYYQNELFQKLAEINLTSNPSDYIYYTLNGAKMVAFYNVIKDTDYIMVTYAPLGKLHPSIVKYITLMFLFIIYVSSLIAIICYYIIKHINKPLDKIIESIHKVQLGDYNERIDYKELNEYGEIAEAFNSLMDTVVCDSEIQSQIDEERIQMERQYRYALEAVSDYVFRFNITDDMLVSERSGWEKICGETLSNSYSDVLKSLLKNVVHPDDVALVRETFSLEAIKKQFKNGNSQISLEFRTSRKNVGYIWYTCVIIPMVDKNTGKLMAIGYIKNINDNKMQQLNIIKNSQRDSLTNLYNKKTTEKLITEYLESKNKNSKHALFLIDIDNFKQLNDTFGHLFGDNVLSDISKKISIPFHSSDIIGRIGGDEFVILLKNYKNIRDIKDKAEDLIYIFRKSFATEDSYHKVSASVGIALYPKDGKSFIELYQSADEAMYIAKNRGRDCYAFHAPKDKK